MNSMKKRKARRKPKFILKKCTPKSSRLYGFATDYKLRYLVYFHICNCFFINFINLKRLVTKKLSPKRKQSSSSSSVKTLKSTCLMITEGYCLSRMKLMRSDDVKFNPGLEPNVDKQARLSDCCQILKHCVTFDQDSQDYQLQMWVVQVTAFLELYHINFMVVLIITFTSDKLLFNTSGIALNVLLKAILRICRMVIWLICQCKVHGVMR